MSRFRRLGVAIAAAGALTALPALTPTAVASPYPGGPSGLEIFHCVGSPRDCIAAADAKDWAFGVTTWKFPGLAAHNDVADAFRHCAWNGAMAQRLGYDRAVRISSNHEVKEKQPQLEYDMDVSNNSVGLSLGSVANRNGGKDTWGWVLKQCHDKAVSKKLYGPGGVEGNY